jgi:hypothetical protein
MVDGKRRTVTVQIGAPTEAERALMLGCLIDEDEAGFKKHFDAILARYAATKT